MKAIHALYEGKVQGVGFRSSILSLVKGYDLTGWVKNLPDHRVALFAMGETQEVDDFLLAIGESHLAGHIEKIDIQAAPPEVGLKGFRIIN
jgi:acylphosphatase